VSLTDRDVAEALCYVIEREEDNPGAVNVYAEAWNLFLADHDEAEIDRAFTALRVGLAFNLRQRREAT
jgi:hypothetical protein